MLQRACPCPNLGSHILGHHARHDAGYFREEPGAGKPPARICEGEAKWPSYSTTTGVVSQTDIQPTATADSFALQTRHSWLQALFPIADFPAIRGKVLVGGEADTPVVALNSRKIANFGHRIDVTRAPMNRQFEPNSEMLWGKDRPLVSMGIVNGNTPIHALIYFAMKLKFTKSSRITLLNFIIITMGMNVRKMGPTNYPPRNR